LPVTTQKLEIVWRLFKGICGTQYSRATA